MKSKYRVSWQDGFGMTGSMEVEARSGANAYDNVEKQYDAANGAGSFDKLDVGVKELQPMWGIRREWILTTDVGFGVIDENCPYKDVEINGVGYDETRAGELTRRFRLYDDDRNLYYEGIATPGVDFEPLDYFGAPNDGCTQIRFLENGVWTTL